MLQRWYAAFWALIQDEEVPEGVMPPRVVHFLRFWIRVVNGFSRNRCPVRASALAYTSLLALIPLLALVVGIASSVLKGETTKIEESIKLGLNSLMPQMESQPQLVKMREEVTSFVMSSINNVNSGTIGATGSIALIVMIIFMLARIEETLNDIWGVSQNRTWYARVVNYWATISLGPIVIFAAVSFSAVLKTAAFEQIRATLPSAANFFIGLAPIPILAGASALFYAVVPNTKVQWRAALLGGLTAGVLWHLNNTMSVLFVSRVSRDSAVFAALAPLPVFMVGLYFFWLLLLFGSQVAYVYQFRQTQLSLRSSERIQQADRELVALRVMIAVGRAFAKSEDTPSVVQLSERLGIPSEILGETVQTLLRNRLLVEAASGDIGLMPTRPLERIRVYDVLYAMRRGTVRASASESSVRSGAAETELARISEAEGKAGARTLAELISA